MRASLYARWHCVRWRRPDRAARAGGRFRGFTAVELLVALTVASIALIGVYGVLQRALRVEGRAAQRWNDESAARAIVAELTRTLARCVNTQGKPLKAGPDPATQTYRLSCFVESAGDGSPQGRAAGYQWRRYEWSLPQDQQPIDRVDLRLIPFAGGRDVSPTAVASGDDDEEPWGRVPASTVASGLDALTVDFRAARDPSAPWVPAWDGPVGQVAIRIEARIGDQVVRAVVVPRASTATW